MRADALNGFIQVALQGNEGLLFKKPYSDGNMIVCHPIHVNCRIAALSAKSSVQPLCALWSQSALNKLRGDQVRLSVPVDERHDRGLVGCRKSIPPSIYQFSRPR